MKKSTSLSWTLAVTLAMIATIVVATDSHDTKVQTICPVMGGKINKEIYADYQGERIYFCCKGCVDEFLQNPGKYVKKLKDQGITLEKTPLPLPTEKSPKPQTKCPVMGGKINKEIYTDYEGNRIYFCCHGCVEKFKADPDMYMKIMEEEGVMLDVDQEWTCSMHPQIRQPKPGRCPLCGMDLIPVTVGSPGGNEGPREITLSPKAIKLAEIQVVPVERKAVSTEIRLVGKIEYDETRLSHITSWVPGRIDHIYVDYTGAPIEKGDPMVHLYSPELLTAQQELVQALKAVVNTNESGSSTIDATALRNLKAVREKLRLWGLTQEQIAEIERQGEPSDHMTIYAPISGTVVEKDCAEGSFVSTGTRLYTIVDLSHVWVQLSAYESDLMWIRLGQEVEFRTEAYPGESFRGTVSFLDPVLDPTTRTVNVRVDAPNSHGKLKPEMFVHALVRSTVANNGMVATEPSPNDIPPLVIPASAPLITGKRAVVYVAVPGRDGVYEGREIVLGPRAGNHYLVCEGLTEGELVVVNGNFKIDSAVQILAKPSMMNPEVGMPAHEHYGGLTMP